MCLPSLCAVAITGGLGTLGTQVASGLAQQGVQNLLLLSRSGRHVVVPAAAATMLQPSGAAFGAAVVMAMNDAASAEGGAGLAAAAAASGHPVLGVMHAGGVLADGVLAAQSLDSLRTVWAPKVAALRQLSAAYGAQPGAFQLLFSSVAALLGSPGQANYSAANAALDAAAQRAQQHGAANTSVQWGAWAGAGMAAGDASTAARVERSGMALLEPQQGLTVLAGMLEPAQMPVPLLAASAFVWDKFLQRLGSSSTAVPPFFAEFASARSTSVGSSSTGAAGQGGRSSGVAALSAADRKAAVLEQVQESVRGILGTDIGPDEPLMAAGLDSLGAVELKNSLEAKMGLQLPGTLVFDYPTEAAIVGYVESVLPEAVADVDGVELALSPLSARGWAGGSPGGQIVSLVGMSNRSAQVR